MGKSRNKQWEKMAPSVHVGEVWVLRTHLHTQSPVRSNSSLMCVSDKYSNSGETLLGFLYILSHINKMMDQLINI